jgi:hypothetical protein
MTCGIYHRDCQLIHPLTYKTPEPTLCSGVFFICQQSKWIKDAHEAIQFGRELRTGHRCRTSSRSRGAQPTQGTRKFAGANY